MHQTLNRMREKRSNDEGFTLIELLVVVVIIGVLVAIAVPVYLNYRQGAADKSAQSDVRGAISAVEQYYTSNANTLPVGAANKSGSITLAATATGSPGTITLSDKTVMTLVSTAAATTYKLCAKNTNGTTNRFYSYDSAKGGSVAGITKAGFSMTTCT